MIKVFADAGADFILFETFRDMREMRLACERIDAPMQTSSETFSLTDHSAYRSG